MVLAQQQLPQKAIAQSVQDQEPADLSSGNLMFYFGLIDKAASWIDPWGSARRQGQLRRLFYHMHNTLIAGALSNLMQRIIQTPTELSGGPRLTLWWNQLFQYAQFGAGWDDFLSPVLQDYLTIDQGAFIEIIAPGAADKPISQQVVGVAHLDSLRCYPTGNPEFPVYYRSHRTNQLHKLHWTRVVRLVDLPSPDPAYKGMGLSALSRALAISQVQIMMSKYQVESLDDLPPKGIVTIGGLTRTQWDQSVGMFNAGQKMDGNDILRNLMALLGVDPEHPPTVTLTPFSTLPAHFDYDKAMQIHVNLLALAIGEDPQEIWPLSGQGLGTGAQSKILHMKGQAKTYAGVLKLLTRTFNLAILPASIEFKFKPKDTEQEKEQAETARSWAFLVSNLTSNFIISTLEARQILVNTVPEYADVLLDKAGNVRLPDSDVKPAEETVVQDDVTPTEPLQNEITATDSETTTRALATKDIQSTRIDFEDAFEDMLNGAVAGTIERRRAGLIARALVSRGIRTAYRDGLKMGGVDPEDISDDDLAMIDLITTDQSGYVTDMLNLLFEDGLAEAEISGKPSMWWNKSVYPAYTAGQMSADRNGYYEWVYGDTEHCDDCRALNGQVHRLKDYESRGWLPKANKLQCGGFNCKCELQKRTGVRANGGYV